MGVTPQQVNDMTMWQFFAALNGFIAANSPKDGNKLTESEREELAADVLAYGAGRGKLLRTQTYWLDGGVLVPWRVVRFAAS